MIGSRTLFLRLPGEATSRNSFFRQKVPQYPCPQPRSARQTLFYRLAGKPRHTGTFISPTDEKQKKQLNKRSMESQGTIKSLLRSKEDGRYFLLSTEVGSQPPSLSSSKQLHPSNKSSDLNNNIRTTNGPLQLVPSRTYSPLRSHWIWEFRQFEYSRPMILSSLIPYKSALNITRRYFIAGRVLKDHYRGGDRFLLAYAYASLETLQEFHRGKTRSLPPVTL